MSGKYNSTFSLSISLTPEVVREYFLGLESHMKVSDGELCCEKTSKVVGSVEDIKLGEKRELQLESKNGEILHEKYSDDILNGKESVENDKINLTEGDKIKVQNPSLDFANRINILFVKIIKENFSDFEETLGPYVNMICGNICSNDNEQIKNVISKHFTIIETISVNKGNMIVEDIDKAICDVDYRDVNDEVKLLCKEMLYQLNESLKICQEHKDISTLLSIYGTFKKFSSDINEALSTKDKFPQEKISCSDSEENSAASAFHMENILFGSSNFLVSILEKIGNNSFSDITTSNINKGDGETKKLTTEEMLLKLSEEED